jgi:hypothetical protein
LLVTREKLTTSLELQICREGKAFKKFCFKNPWYTATEKMELLKNSEKFRRKLRKEREGFGVQPLSTSSQLIPWKDRNKSSEESSPGSKMARLSTYSLKVTTRHLT